MKYPLQCIVYILDDMTEYRGPALVVIASMLFNPCLCYHQIHEPYSHPMRSAVFAIVCYIITLVNKLPLLNSIKSLDLTYRI